MGDQFEGGPPLLTEVISSGLDEIESLTQQHKSHPEIDLLRAQLPELFEKALLRVKPQLLEEFEKLVIDALKKTN